MQESFTKSKEKEASHILQIFGQLTSKANHEGKVSDCDKIQLSYFIDNKPNKIRSKDFSVNCSS